MILEVEVTPFTVEVSVLPEAEVVKELMKLIAADEIPFTMFVNVLVVVETVLDEITEVVAVTPLIVEVRVLPDND